MDLVMIDVTDIPGVGLGDEVILMGSQGSEVITAQDVAKIPTISYEFLCGIGRGYHGSTLKAGISCKISVLRQAYFWMTNVILDTGFLVLDWEKEISSRIQPPVSTR